LLVIPGVDFTPKRNSHAQTRETVSVSINIRAKARQRDLIDQAADRLGRSRSGFMLGAACREAEDVLPDQHSLQSMKAPLPNFR